MFPTKQRTGGLRVPLVSFASRDPNVQQEVFPPAVVRVQGRISPPAPKSGKYSGIFTDLVP